MRVPYIDKYVCNDFDSVELWKMSRMAEAPSSRNVCGKCAFYIPDDDGTVYGTCAVARDCDMLESAVHTPVATCEYWASCLAYAEGGLCRYFT